MAIINAELNVKKNSTEYDQLHLTSDASLVNYDSAIGSLDTVKKALDYVIEGKYKTITNQDVLDYLIENQKNDSSMTIRGYDNPNPPTGQSPSNNDLFYVSFRNLDSYIRIIALDNRSNKIYSNSRRSGTWEGWIDLSNAETVNGFTASQWQSLQSNGTPSTTWLENKWDGQAYIVKGKNTSGATYPTQVDNSDTVDGFHANTAIGTSALKPIYAGTADMVAGTTNLAQGTIYFVYE